MKALIKPAAFVIFPIAVGYCVWAAFKHYKKKYRHVTAAEAFNKLDIRVVSSENECDGLIEELERRCRHNNFSALGMDCEWVQCANVRSPVALLQLSTFDGLCVLLQLSRFKGIPKSLMDLLSNEAIYKLGVSIRTDAKYLAQSYKINTKSSLDIRYVAKFCGYNPIGLAALAKDHLNVILPKNCTTIRSDWEKEVLSEEQIFYAAADAHVGIKIFHKLLKEYEALHGNSDDVKFFNIMCMDNRDIDFRYSNKSFCKPVSLKLCPAKANYKLKTLKTPLYDNCVLEAPDGKFLSTVPKKKLDWYLKRNLGEQVSDKTVRLSFEPSARLDKEEDREHHMRENCCVVCASAKDCIRKNIVPRRYRKQFPKILKEYSSCDVVLLCINCHRISNMYDAQLTERFETLFRELTPNTTLPRDIKPKFDKRGPLARALLNKNDQIPEWRLVELRSKLLELYPEHEKVTPELLEEASKLEFRPLSPLSPGATHGEVIVKYYVQHKGLLKLEQEWRQHFLDTMKPAYLPKNWSLKITEERLYACYMQGSVKDEELESIGFRGWTII